MLSLKVRLILAGLLFLQNSVKAQDVGLFLESGLPLGEFQNNHKMSVGGGFSASYALEDNADLCFSAGYLRFLGKSFEDEYLAYKIDDWKAIPLRLGGKYFATRHLFLKAEAGAVFFVAPGHGTSLIISPGIGLRVRRFEAAAKLETWTNGGTVSFAGFSLGYFFFKNRNSR